MLHTACSAMQTVDADIEGNLIQNLMEEEVIEDRAPDNEEREPVQPENMLEDLFDLAGVVCEQEDLDEYDSGLESECDF